MVVSRRAAKPRGRLLVALAHLGLLASLTGREGVASDRDTLEGEPASSTQRVVLYIPARPADDTPYRFAEDLETLQRNLPNYLVLPPAGTEYVHVFTPAFTRRFESAYPQERRNLSCGGRYEEDFFRRELARLSLEIVERAGEPEFQIELENLVTRFDCQTGGDPLTPVELRQALLFQGIDFFLSGDAQGRDRVRFGEAYGLGVKEALGEGLEGLFGGGGVWETYTQAVKSYQQRYHRIPVRFDLSRLPTRLLYVDGEPVNPRALTVEPLLLYPGLHFLQIRDTRGRMRSATFQVDANQQAFRLELGRGDYFPPRPAEADELLWQAMSASLITLPDWLKQSLNDYLNENKLEALYLVTPADDRRNGPGGDLLVARFEAGGGLLEVEPFRRGPLFMAMTGRAPVEQGRLEPDIWSVGMGGGNLTSRMTVSLEARAALLSRGTFRVMVGASAIGVWKPELSIRGMAMAWGGVLREPDAPRFGWIYGASIGLLTPGPVKHGETEGSRPLVLPVPRAILGVEWPLRDIYRLRARKGVPALRLELHVSAVPGLEAAFPGARPIEVLMEGRIGLRFWRWHLAGE